MKARIVIGSNYGDEGKGTVVASYTKKSNNVLNVLTNGGAQRGHSILTKDGNITNQHFGSGTYFGADNYYSRYFILNPMQFVKEYNSLIVKPNKIYVDNRCIWSTPYDMMANLISEQQIGRHASCCMGIWNTIKRSREFTPFVSFRKFVSEIKQYPNVAIYYLVNVKNYYERNLIIPDEWKPIWNGENIMFHFMEDCKFMAEHTEIINNFDGFNYDEVIFENGQGLLLCDTGKDTYDTTPSLTGIAYALDILKGLNVEEVTAHYVTRPYLTRHGDGEMENQSNRMLIASSVNEDRTNQYNDVQGDFRYGLLDIESLKERILKDVGSMKFELEVTHCDEMDRISEFKNIFAGTKINTYDSPLV